MRFPIGSGFGVRGCNKCVCDEAMRFPIGSGFGVAINVCVCDHA